jgi:uncharacterized membrane protein YbjE (DUF340 family)
MDKRYQENKIAFITIAIPFILATLLFVVGYNLTNNGLAQTLTKSDAAMIQAQLTNMSDHTANKTKTPIAEINNTEIGRATPTTD